MNKFSLRYIKWWFRNLNKHLLFELGLRHSNDAIHFFMQENPRFKNAGNERQWIVLSADGSRIGFIWFKHLLGGYRLRLDKDKGNEWEQRGVINSIHKLKSFL